MKERQVVIPVAKVKDGEVTEITFPFKVSDDFDGVITDDSLERVKETVNRLTEAQLRPQGMVKADQIQLLRQIGTGEYIVLEGNYPIYDYRNGGGPTMDNSMTVDNVEREPAVVPVADKMSLLEQLKAKTKKRDELLTEANKIADAIEQLNTELEQMRDSAITEAENQAAYYSELAKSLRAEAKE